MGKLKKATCPGCKNKIGRHDAARISLAVVPRHSRAMLWYRSGMRAEKPLTPSLTYHLSCAQEMEMRE